MKLSRWIVVAAGVVVTVALFVLLRPSGGDPPPASSLSPSASASPSSGPAISADPSETGSPSPTEEPSPSPDAVEIEIEVEDGKVSGPGEFEVTQGERVRLVVEADISDEVHVHGYDLTADVTPQEPAVIVFRADAPGVYEVELESAGLLLLELSVVP